MQASGDGIIYSWGPGAGPDIVRHSNRTIAAMPMRESRRDRVKPLRRTLVGGILDLATFHPESSPPPPGRTMTIASRGPCPVVLLYYGDFDATGRGF